MPNNILGFQYRVELKSSLLKPILRYLLFDMLNISSNHLWTDFKIVSDTWNTPTYSFSAQHDVLEGSWRSFL